MAADKKRPGDKKTRHGKNPVRRSGKSGAGKTPSHGMRIAVWTALSLLVLFVLFLTVSLLIFSPFRRMAIPAIGPRHFQVLNRVSSQVAEKTFCRNPPAEATLRLTPEEVNSLLELAQNAAATGVAGAPPPGTFQLKYLPDGSVSFAYPFDAAPSWLFGGKIYLRGRLHLEKQGEKLLLDVPELKFGRAELSIPGGGMFLGSAGTGAAQRALPPEFHEAIRDFYPERDGTLVLVYHPGKLLPLLLSAAAK